MKTLFHPILPSSRKSTVFLEGSKTWPICPPGKSSMKLRMTTEPLVSWRKTNPIGNSSTTSLT